ncbi:MAG: dTDP-4-dehydrorhamnose reductase [Vulcanimicrobiaceae bacterium]
MSALRRRRPDPATAGGSHQGLGGLRVLLIGGSGQLGAEILREWSDCRVLAPTHTELPLEDGAALEQALERIQPDVVVNAAAFHNVDRCEAEPERAFAVNALAVDRLAGACAQRDCVFVTLSTDYVFDGDLGRPYTEADCPAPISVYGASKLGGEQLVLRRRSRAFVVRTCGLYGVRPSATKGYTFVDRIIAQARAGEPVRVVDDMVASPTYAVHLARALRALVATQAYGLSHCANVGAVSWHAFASAALELAGIAHPIEAIASASWSAPARRPRFSALANGRLQSLGIAMPSWRQGLCDYLTDRVTRGLTS